MPLGAMMARYMKVFADPTWFYLHIAFQVSGYAIGVAGWATGIKLGNDSPGTSYSTHRNLGIALFTFATLQVFALLLRPKPDHKYRTYWNVYHHTVGYTTIILSIVNIFKGFDILDPADKWRWAYIGILIFLGACILILEPLTWFIVLRRKSRGGNTVAAPTSNKYSNGVNGTTSTGPHHQAAQFHFFLFLHFFLFVLLICNFGFFFGFDIFCRLMYVCIQFYSLCYRIQIYQLMESLVFYMRVLVFFYALCIQYLNTYLRLYIVLKMVQFRYKISLINVSLPRYHQQKLRYVTSTHQQNQHKTLY